LSKVKLLYIIGDLGYGGAEKHLTHVLRELDKSKYQPFVACFRKKGQYLPEIEKLNIPVINLGVGRIYNLKGIIKIFSISSFINKNKINIVQSYLYGANFFGAISARIAGVPAITSNRNVTSLLSKKQMLLHKAANKLATVITAVSEEVRRSDIEQGTPPDKIVTIYNGVEIQKAKISIDKVLAQKIELGLDPDCAVIGTVANLHLRKDHRNLLHAATRVVSIIPKVQFLLVGNGHLREELEKLTEDLNLKNKVIFAGHRSDVPELLSLMDIFVLPSLTEGMSNALLEAMAAELPCVATKVGGNPEVVQDGVTGFVVSPKDPESMAGAIIKLLQDKDLASKMGKSGQHEVMTNFTIDRMVSQLEQLYERLLSN